MKGDRVEAVVDTGQGVQTFEIVATRAGRRIEVTTSRGVVEVTEVTRSGNPVRTGRFMASRVVALVEHPAIEGDGSQVEITTRRRLSPPRHPDSPGGRRAAGRERSTAEGGQLSLGALADDEPEPADDEPEPAEHH